MPQVKPKSFYHSTLPIHMSEKTDMLTILAQNMFPHSVASFNQDEWIQTLNEDYKRYSSKGGSTFFKKSSIPLIGGGLCSGLLHTWYDYLLRGKNLIDVLRNGSPNPLNNAIIDCQKTYGLKCSTSNSNYAVINKCKSTSEYALAINTHMENIKAEGRDAVGLHAVSHISHGSFEYQEQEFNRKGSQSKVFKGHVSGWTAVKDGYLYFDANTGEHFCKTYEKLKRVICHALLNQRTPDGITIPARDYILQLTDFYTPADIKELECATKSQQRLRK